jgi:hypothetical protein
VFKIRVFHSFLFRSSNMKHFVSNQLFLIFLENLKVLFLLKVLLLFRIGLLKNTFIKNTKCHYI